jgi:hypothetical protein
MSYTKLQPNSTILQRTLLPRYAVRTFTQTSTFNMPLVVPGLQSKDGNQDDWMSKLMGKKLGEQSDEMVCP